MLVAFLGRRLVSEARRSGGRDDPTIDLNLGVPETAFAPPMPAVGLANSSV